MEELKFTHETFDGITVFKLSGSIDHHTVRSVREGIDGELYKNRARDVVLDLSGVEFMDSSGLGLILGRYSKVTDMGGRLTLTGMSDEVMKIIRLAGVDKFIRCEKKHIKERSVKNA